MEEAASGAVSSPEQCSGVFNHPVNCWKQVDLWSQVQHGWRSWACAVCRMLLCGSADAEDAPGQKQNRGLEMGVLWPGECRVTREVTPHSFLRTLPVQSSCSHRQRHDQPVAGRQLPRKRGARRMLKRAISSICFPYFLLNLYFLSQWTQSCRHWPCFPVTTWAGWRPSRWAAGKAGSDACTHLCPPGATAAEPTPCTACHV